MKNKEYDEWRGKKKGWVNIQGNGNKNKKMNKHNSYCRSSALDHFNTQII